MLDSRLFENFVLADEPLAKTLPSLEICVLGSNNFCGKSVSSLELKITFEEFHIYSVILNHLTLH